MITKTSVLKSRIAKYFNELLNPHETVFFPIIFKYLKTKNLDFLHAQDQGEVQGQTVH